MHSMTKLCRYAFSNKDTRVDLKKTFIIRKYIYNQTIISVRSRNTLLSIETENESCRRNKTFISTRQSRFFLNGHIITILSRLTVILIEQIRNKKSEIKCTSQRRNLFRYKNLEFLWFVVPQKLASRKAPHLSGVAVLERGLGGSS